jgi:uncharacterized protein YicC (UPF0701 family)
LRYVLVEPLLTGVAANELEARRAVVASNATQLRAEFEARWAKQAQDRQQEITAIAECMFEELDKLIDRFEAHSARLRNAVLDAVETRLTAMEMQIKAAESRVKGAFQFAREKEESGTIVDLPNPLKPRRLDS